MRRRHYLRHVVVGLALLAALSLGRPAGAQQYRGAGRRGMRERRGEFRRVPADPAVSGAMRGRIAPVHHQAGMGLLAHPEVSVDVEEIADGVTIRVTSQEPELAEKIRQELPKRLNWLRQAGRRLRRRAGASGVPVRARRQRALAEKVNVETEPLDDGLMILVTSDEPEQAEVIKRVLPKRIEAMRHFASGARVLRESARAHPGLARARDWFGLMLSEDVQVQLIEKDNGVLLELTSDDPETVERLKEMMRERIERMEKARERLEERKGRLEGEEEHPRLRARRLEAQAPLHPGLGVAPAPRGNGRELREIIRQEIRRYLL